MTFGFRRAEILAAQANGVTLLAARARDRRRGAAAARLAARGARRARASATALAGAAVNVARALAGRAREPAQPERRGQLPPPPDRPLRVRGDRRSPGSSSGRPASSAPTRSPRSPSPASMLADRLAAPAPQRAASCSRRRPEGSRRTRSAPRSRAHPGRDRRARPARLGDLARASRRSRPTCSSAATRTATGSGATSRRCSHERFGLDHTTLQVEHTSDRLLDDPALAKRPPGPLTLRSTFGADDGAGGGIGASHSSEWRGLFSFWDTEHKERSDR